MLMAACPDISCASAESGFTLVEVIVGMVLLVGVVAVAAGIMMTVAGSNQNAKASTAALVEATRAVDQMGRDLRAVIAPERSHGEVPRALLREYVLHGRVDAEHDMREILSASPTELWFRADVSPGATGELPQAECVRYRSADDGLWREVYANWRNCPSNTAPIETTRLVRRPADAPADMPQSVFTYTLWYNRDTSKTPLDPADCAKTVNVTGPFAVGDARNNYIGAIHVDLRSTVANARAVGDTRLSDTFNLRMRFNGEYQYALGCAT